MEEQKSKKFKNVDVRFLYILPSLLAFIFAFTSFSYQFGNAILDLKNTCYTLYLNTPENKTVDEMISELDEMLVRYDISGFTINQNTQGLHGHIKRYLIHDSGRVEENLWCNDHDTGKCC